MNEEDLDAKRPGRKALFIGAPTKPPAGESKPKEESGTEFAGLVLKTITKYNGDDENARIDESGIGEEYLNTAKSINSLLDSFSQAKISSDNTEEKEKLKAELDKITEELSASETRLKSSETEVSRLNDLIKENEDVKQANGEELLTLREENERLKEQGESRSDNEGKISELEEEKKKLAGENEELKRKAEEKDGKITAAEAEIEALKEENDNLKEQGESGSKELESRISELEEEKKIIAGENEEKKRKAEERDGKITAAEAEILALKEENKNLREQGRTGLKNIEDKISALEEKNKDLHKENLELKERLGSSERYSDTLINQNPMPILILDQNLRIKTANRTFEALSGIPGSKLTGMSARELKITDVKGDDYSKALNSGLTCRAEISMQMSSGIHVLDQYAIPLKENGNRKSGVLLIFNDITKEKAEAEDIRKKLAEIENLKTRSETIVQENPMPILLLNKKFDVIVANLAFEEMSGISLSRLKGMSARDFRIIRQEGQGIKYAMESKSRASGEVEIEMPAGLRILEQYCIPILNEKKEIINILAVYNDITDIRTKNAEIEVLREKEREETEILSKSAEMITENMILMSEGDLTVNVEIFEDDPLQVLKTNFNSTAEDIKELITLISEKSETIDRTSGELNNNTDGIAKANEKLAINSMESAEFSRKLMEKFEKISFGISDLSASIEEISSTSQEVMKQTNQAATEGKDAAVIGKEASEKMEMVGRISQQSVNEINLLNEEMYKINEIVKLIGGIAEQTNMLALNAAIEAARAGEHGRGFSVVAGEVKNLAGESKEAAKTIEELISEIQKNSNNTANSMKQVDEEIRVGIESVNAAVDALNNIATDIDIASRGVTEISHATETQANEINQFMLNIEEANTLTRENLNKLDGMAALAQEISATTQEVGSISHEMHDVSGSLQELMKKFRIV